MMEIVKFDARKWKIVQSSQQWRFTSSRYRWLLVVTYRNAVVAIEKDFVIGCHIRV